MLSNILMKFWAEKQAYSDKAEGCVMFSRGALTCWLFTLRNPRKNYTPLYFSCIWNTNLLRCFSSNRLYPPGIFCVLWHELPVVSLYRVALPPLLLSSPDSDLFGLVLLFRSCFQLCLDLEQ